MIVNIHCEDRIIVTYAADNIPQYGNAVDVDGAEYFVKSVKHKINTSTKNVCAVIDVISASEITREPA